MVGLQDEKKFNNNLQYIQKHLGGIGQRGKGFLMATIKVWRVELGRDEKCRLCSGYIFDSYKRITQCTGGVALSKHVTLYGTQSVLAFRIIT